MEFLTTQFLSSLAAIVVIDLMLAGDNAIVIALAARNVPAHLQKRAIAWGTVGAVVVRSLMTLVVVWLLAIPGLLFVGGALLIWIAYKLLIPDETAEEGHAVAGQATGFWGAMRTIVIADAVMGLDNVLAVAGAAHGSYVLVVLGLLISIPIVVWGSTWLLKWVERYPVIVYVGAGVLAWTAVKMIVSEPYLREAFARDEPVLVAFLYLLVVGGVLFGGFAHNHRRLESRISARLARLAARRPDPEGASQPEKAIPMKTILVPVGDSRNSLFAVRRVVNEFMSDPAMEVHLLNVQAPLPRHISQFLGRRTLDDFHRDRAEAALAPAREILRSHNLPFSEHIRLGDRPAIIAGEAKRLGCDHIVMSTARKNSLTRMLESSTTNRVLELTTIPVEVVAGDEISKLERYGVPAGFGSALALAIAAAID
jgi:YjbE family integral membrane protein